MRFSRLSIHRRFHVLPAATLLCAAVVAFQSPAPLDAQLINAGYQQAVGGISIRSDGVIENASVDTLNKLAAQRAKLVQEVPAGLKAAASLRKVSLRGLEDAIEDSLKSNKALPDEVVLLGGLQDIRYVFVYPEQKDIVLVGFGEGWRIDPHGNIVGISSGKPVLLLDDLLTALRSAARSSPAGISGTQAGISCSIDPTQEGIQELRKHAATLGKMDDKKTISAGLAKALGRQTVTFSGVPATSHFASVLVAADYRMKCLAMSFERSPVRGMPDFLHMYTSPGLGVDNLLQRWWLEPTYESVLRSPDGLAWEFDGAGVKCMTEEDFATANGKREHSGKPSAVAQKWADNMTKHYDELAVAAPVFGELRNCMQLALVGALIAHERLADRAGCNLPALTQETTLKTMALSAPTQVDSRVSMVKQGSNWIISASGGVHIRPGAIVSQARESSAPVAARAKAQGAGKAGWYWN
jgi:hypothetical protein